MTVVRRYVWITGLDLLTTRKKLNRKVKTVNYSTERLKWEIYKNLRKGRNYKGNGPRSDPEFY